MSSTYTQYLGAKKCCQLNVRGPQGFQGPPGETSIGPVGYQGATGAQGYQGATGRGCKGDTGAQGAPGESLWTPMSAPGYNGIGVTGEDVLIYGNLLVSGNYTSGNTPVTAIASSGNLIIECNGYSSGTFQISTYGTVYTVTINNAVSGGQYLVYLTASGGTLTINNSSLTPSPSLGYTNKTNYGANVVMTSGQQGLMKITTNGTTNFIGCELYT